MPSTNPIIHVRIWTSILHTLRNQPCSSIDEWNILYPAMVTAKENRWKAIQAAGLEQYYSKKI